MKETTITFSNKEIKTILDILEENQIFVQLRRDYSHNKITQQELEKHIQLVFNIRKKIKSQKRLAKSK